MCTLMFADLIVAIAHAHYITSRLKPSPESAWPWLAPMASEGDTRQLWVGNIPQGISEAEALETMAMYSVRPYKLILRQRSQAGQE